MSSFRPSYSQRNAMDTSSESETIPSLLTTIAMDIQIKICSFLHPSDILALRETCKELQLVTKERTIWIEALHRMCIDNALFIPSFPIPDMSNVQLEGAAMAPHRWIKLCAEFAKQHPSDPNATLYPKKRRIIQHPKTEAASDSSWFKIFLVPGGRYLVGYSFREICVWDLGYTSNADCKLLASVSPEGGTSDCVVNTTSDGMGLIIVSFIPRRHCSVYEIYPQSKTPQLTQIAHLDVAPFGQPVYLLPDKVVCYNCYRDSIDFSIWDYRLNHSTRFTAEIDVNTVHFAFPPQIIATKIVIMVLCKEKILVWSVSSLSPGLHDLLDRQPHFMPAHFTIPFPDDLIHAERFQWEMISDWYSGSPQSIYLGVLGHLDQVHNFQIVVKADLSDISLHPIHTSQFAPDYSDAMLYEPHSLCEDTLIACTVRQPDQCVIHIRPTSSCPPNAISLEAPIVLNASLYGVKFDIPSLCPGSGRFVYVDIIVKNIFVVDFL